MKPLSLLSFILLFFSVSASAHPGHGLESAYAGFMHPLTGWDHLLVMLAIGVWAAQLGREWRWRLPITFMLFMVVGMLLSVFGIHFSGLETSITTSVLAMGVLLLIATRLPLSIRLIITGMFATIHGMAHGVELVTYQRSFAAFGMLLATGLLHLAGVWLGSQQSPIMAYFKRLMAWSMLLIGAYWVVV